MKTELLAPAKDFETAKIAIDCGADAVYIGGPSFGARSKASNSIEDLVKLVEYAHKFYVKVYVTLNTILSDNELDEARKLIKTLHDIHIDGLIIQDMGILQMAIDSEIPPIPLHISTQCNNRELNKIEFFERIGIPRVVLARELSLEQIKEIKNNTNIELECFIHGALCVSYSGQCYLSEYIGGRSANRGECAQPCRKKYSLIDEEGNFLIKDKHLLSTKDFNASKYLKEMINIGVKSFKIEGRLKDKEYVKNVVLYYRNLLDTLCDKTSSGIVKTDFNPNINKSFNRGYTDYFLKQRGKCFNFDSPKNKGEFIGKVVEIKKNYIIIDTNKKLNPQDGLTIKSTGCLINKIEKDKIYPNIMPEVNIGDKVYRNKDFTYEKKLNNEKIQRKIRVDISISEDGILTAIDEDKNIVHLNTPIGEPANNQTKINRIVEEQLKKTGDTDFIIINYTNRYNFSFLPISKINELRRDLLKKLMFERLKNYKRDIQNKINYTDFYKREEDYRANVYNKKAEIFYENCNCRVIEPAFEQKHKSSVELMRTKHCLKYALNICKSPQKLFLIDEKGKKYPLKFDCKNCEMVIQG